MTRWLDRPRLYRIRDITPAGEDRREPGKITARYPGSMVHVNAKKIGKVERCRRIMTEECLYARADDSDNERRDAIGVRAHHCSDHRPRTVCGGRHPAARLHAGVDSIMSSCS